jgi:aminopeptidase N
MRWNATSSAFSFAVLLGSALAVAPGCNDRIGQCNALITVINDEQAKHKDLNGDSPAEMKKLGEALETTAKRIGDVEVKDEKLKAFRDDYKAMCEDLAKAAREASDAGEDSKKREDAVKVMQTIGPREDKLVNEINGYCQGT